MAMDNTRNVSSRDKKKFANRARHRLLSIRYDVEHYLKPLLFELSSSNLAIVANERCGTWYALPFLPSQQEPQARCHFKSTDGHVHLFSLKRLNLAFLKFVVQSCSSTSSQQVADVLVVDASNKKELPDSFSRTLPIWACVLNRIAEKYRRELGMDPLLVSGGDDDDAALHPLYVPSWEGIVSESERIQMQAIIETRVEELYTSQAIVDVPGFLRLITKPLRPFWITPHHSELPQQTDTHSTECFPIICCNASNYRLDFCRADKNMETGSTRKTPATATNNGSKSKNNRAIVWIEEDYFWYTPGASDDEESFTRKMTPQLFWDHVEKFSADLTDRETDDLIDTLVQQQQQQQRSQQDVGEESIIRDNFDWIGNLRLAIGSRRAGRPPDCWKSFDAILNVTDTEYEDMKPSSLLLQQEHGKEESSQPKFYLQMPVQEGKRDRVELEQWLALGIVFCATHILQGRRILIHCAQGRDRSVAVAMAVIQLFGCLRYPLEWNRDLLERTVPNFVVTLSSETSNSEHSGMQLTTNPETTTPTRNTKDGAICVGSLDEAVTGLPQLLMQGMLGHQGRDVLQRLVREQSNAPEGSLLASKESLRIVLHLIRQDRDVAEPTRFSMQKLNRFFMSDAFKKSPPQS